MIYENNPARPGYVPFPEPHHVHQPYPYPVPPRHMSDLEPAFVVRPGEDCCPGPQPECECVTSGDVMRWNHAADITESLTEEQIAGLSSIPDVSEIIASASAWNSCYDTVSANSADWEEIRNLSSFSADTLNKFDEIESAFNDVHDELSALDKKIPNYYFDNDPITGSLTGDGSVNLPIGVREWHSYSGLRSEFNELWTHIIKIKADELGPGEKYIFDGNKFYADKMEDQYQSVAKWLAAHDTQLRAIEGNVTNLTDVANRAIEGNKTYHGSQYINIVPLDGSTHDFHVFLNLNSVDDIPGMANDVRTIAKETVNNALNAKGYVEFTQLESYPKSEYDIKNKTGRNMIYWSV